MKEAEQWIKNLALQPHPEGGFYGEVYRSSEFIPGECLPHGFNGPRNISTSIYYLLRSGERSNFHRLKSDEIWYFHAGSPLTIVMLRGNRAEHISLGMEMFRGQFLQDVVPAHTWFGAFVPTPGEFALCSCNVAPGFDFTDFEMGVRNDLISRFPTCRTEIELLTQL